MPTDQRLIMNIANKIKHITAAQEGVSQSQQTLRRTSLWRCPIIAKALWCNMFRFNRFQPGVWVNDGYLQGFSGL
jgi:hypothetical protein